MEVSTLKKAIAEAKRFIEAAENVPIVNTTYANGKPYVYVEYSKQSAACKRASMDLTRVLADLRQGR